MLPKIEPSTNKLSLSFIKRIQPVYEELVGQFEELMAGS